jgi:hypothetical protein
MNFTESFQEFSSKLGPMDLALYAGVGIVLWVLFKDKLSPVQKMLTDLISKVSKPAKAIVKSTPNDTTVVESSKNNKDSFFDLVVSWKQTRDLAVLNGCQKAVEVADQMFPYLSPNICKENTDDTEAAK